MSTLAIENIEHTNGTNAMTVNDGGAVTFPSIPCCYVRLTTSNVHDTSNPFTTTGTDIKLDKIDLNQGSCYDASTGRFTVSVAGVYEANCQFLTNASSSTDKQFSLYKNGTAVHYGYHGVNSQHVEMHVHALLSLVPGDYLTVRLDQGEIYIDGSGGYSAFAVKLIG